MLTLFFCSFFSFLCVCACVTSTYTKQTPFVSNSMFQVSHGSISGILFFVVCRLFSGRKKQTKGLSHVHWFHLQAMTVTSGEKISQTVKGATTKEHKIDNLNIEFSLSSFWYITFDFKQTFDVTFVTHLEDLHHLLFISSINSWKSSHALWGQKPVSSFYNTTSVLLRTDTLFLAVLCMWSGWYISLFSNTF